MTQEQIDSIRERMCDNFCWFHGNRISLEELESACEICPLNELEASAEPKKGQWIFAKHFVWECSECGKNPTRGMGYTQSRSELFRYCPYCGTEMEVKDE